MKSYILTLALMVFGGTALAQTTYTGIVVDTKGQPMPGAKVQVKGTNESVLTNMDGTYTITTTKHHPRLTTVYAGWNPRRVSAKSDQVIKMSKTTWWNEKPEHWQFFVGADLAFANTLLSPGLTIGAMKRAGLYVKGHYNDWGYRLTDCECWTTGHYHEVYKSVGAGLIARLGCPLHLYVGSGWDQHYVAYKKVCGDYLHIDSPNGAYIESDGAYIESGLMLRGRHWYGSGGVSYDFYNDDDISLSGTIGIGYIF